MNTNLTTSLLLGVYTAVVIFLAVRDSSSKGAENFAIAKRNVGSFPIMAAVVGNLRDGAGIVAWVVLGIYFGFGALWLTVGLCLGLLVLGVLAPKLRRLAAEHDYLSVNQMIRDRVGPVTERIATLVIAGTAFLYGAAQMNIAGSVFGSLLDIPSWIGVLLTAGVVGLYLAIGGFATTIRTSVFQWFMLLIILLLPWLIQTEGRTMPGLETLLKPDGGMIFAFVGISLLVTLSSTDLWQLCFAAKSGSAGRRGMYWSIPVYLIISIATVLFAAIVAQAVGPGVKAEDAFFSLFQLESIPTLVLALVGTFVAAAIMSTLDSQIFVFSSTLLGQFRSRLNTDEESTARSLRYSIVVAAIVLAALSVTITDLIQFLFGAVTLATILVPVLLVTASNTTRRLSDIGASTVLLVAAGVYIILFTQGAFANLLWTLVPASVSLIGTLILMQLGRTEAPANADASLEEYPERSKENSPSVEGP